MTATAQPEGLPVRPGEPGAPERAAPGGSAADGSKTILNRAEGVELLGPVHGCGYRDGAALVRRADGQMVQLGGLMYGLLECIDGERDQQQLAEALSERLGRRVGEEHVARLAQKLGRQGLLGGTEHLAPPRRNPLLALRWKVLVTDPKWTRRLTTPFTFLFRPWLMWPIIAAFAAVVWFVLIHKGVASATAQAFHKPGLLLLVFALAVISAGFHELGHAAACRYGGANPGGMGMGLYIVWPAFYTDVTDTYRLPKRARLRVDLAGLYFNAVVAVITLGVWLAWRNDALLLLVALQVLQMVKQLSPVIRADGYHILSDATGVPDLYAQMGPALKRLLPRYRGEPSALTGRARLLVTVWVLIMVPILISLSLGAVLLLPKIGTSAWDSGRHIIQAIPHQADHGRILSLLAGILRLLALSLPVLGSVLVTQRIVRTTGGRARAWSRGHVGRQTVVALATTAIAAGLAWAWWPSGQYRPVRADQHGTLGSLVSMVTDPQAVARPVAALAPVQLSAGVHLAEAMVPVDGASKRHPAIYIITGGGGKPPVEILSSSAPRPGAGVPRFGDGGAGGLPAGSTETTATDTIAPDTTATDTTSTTGTTAAQPTGTTPSSAAGSSPGSSPAAVTAATAFPFKLPAPPGPHGTQALAVNTTQGGVVYDVAYSLVTVKPGTPVDETNSAYAFAHCQACTTVAVSVQLVLIVGQTKDIAPINAAGSLNYDCPACTTTALADQLVVSLKKAPSQQLIDELDADLRQLGALPELGAAGTPAAVAAQVAAVQQQLDQQLNASGDLANPITTTTTTSGQSPGTTTSTGSSGSSTDSGDGSTGASSPTSGDAASTTSGNSGVPSTPTQGSGATTPTSASTTSATSTTPTGTTPSTTTGTTPTTEDGTATTTPQGSTSTGSATPTDSGSTATDPASTTTTG